MISVREEPKRRQVLEIAIVVSIFLHLVLGSFFAVRYPQVTKMLERVTKPQKNQQMVALSSAVTIEKRTRPRVAPPTQPRPKPVPPQPRVQPRVVKVERPKPPQPAAKPTEIARIVPHAAEQPRAAHNQHVVARISPPRTKNQSQYSPEQLEQMQQQFARTIATSKQQMDPTRVAAAPPAQNPTTMKHAHIDIAGVNELLRHGEGILTPLRWWRVSIEGDTKGTCYYVNFSVNFADGGFDQGPVYWPICYARKQDPFLNDWQRFPLPGPPAGWQPDQKMWPVIAQHPVLRAYFPDKFPADDRN